MLIGQHTQNGYVCDNMDDAIALFRERGLEREPIVIPVEQTVQTPNGPKFMKMLTASFWTNGVQFELIEPIVDETNIYSNTQSNDGPMRFHHICMKVDDWDDLLDRLSRQKFPIAMEGGDDQLRFLYLDAREAFGHYLEYIWTTDEIWEQIKAM